MQARCRGTFFLFFLPLLLFAAGCRNRTDLVENEARSKDAMYRAAKEDQLRMEFQLRALQMEVAALRQGSKISPELAASTFNLKRIALGRATGAFDRDNLPGDEILQVVVEPRDYDDHTIKAPGLLQICTFETTPQGIKVPLCYWDIPPDKLAGTWKQGLLSTGYTLELPWVKLPVFESVRVVVRFTTPDQRVFETDKDIKVRIVAGAIEKRADPPLQLLPTPRPLPPEGAPILMPTTGQAPAYPHQQTQWQPASLQKAVTIGRPESLNIPAAPR